MVGGFGWMRVGGDPLAPTGGDVMASAGCYRDTEEGLLTESAGGQGGS